MRSAKLLLFHFVIMLEKLITILSRFLKSTCEGELEAAFLLNRCSYNFSKIFEKYLWRISFLVNSLTGTFQGFC